MNKWSREWGAIAFVATVIVGALAVGVSLLFSSGVSSGSGPTLPPCPTVAKATATPKTPTSATPTAAATPSESFNAIFANCPTATAPPGTPTPTPVPGSTPVPTATAVATPTAPPFHPTPLP